MRNTALKKQDDFWKGTFMAMASPCDVLLEAVTKQQAQEILTAVANEAWRIEDKFSRYKQDNIIFQINNAAGVAVTVDAETDRLLDFADELFRLSEGLFDVTSGVLRQVWTFDGGSHFPDAQSINAILKNIGWQKLKREKG